MCIRDRKDIREKIERGIANLESQVKDKTNAYDIAFSAKDYQQCLRLCDELLAIGADSSVWTEQRQIIKEKIKKEQIFQDNYELARAARLKHNWSEVVEYAQKALEVKEDSTLNSWITEAEDAMKHDEQSRIQEEFVLAYANEQWGRVIELYNTYSSLRKKSSNSTMWNKARRLKNQSSDKRFSPKVVVKDEPNPTTTILKKKNRPRPSRPKVGARPRLTEKTASMGQKSENKNVFNKPKR